MSDDIGVLEDITDKVLKGEIVFEWYNQYI